jgi:hypothetical protein
MTGSIPHSELKTLLEKREVQISNQKSGFFRKRNMTSRKDVLTGGTLDLKTDQGGTKDEANICYGGSRADVY